MQGIIYIAHGSKKPEKNQQFRKFIDLIINERNERIQRLAFLEKDDENVPFTMAEMLEHGVTQFIVMPMLLFPAMHAMEDIPSQIEAALKEYPHCSYTIADCFGDEESVWRTALKKLNTTADMILIIAHGNARFSVPDERLTEVVRLMQLATKKKLIPAMLYGALSFEEKLEAVNEDHIAIMPYFLFDGHLVRKIKRLSQPFIEKGMHIDFMDTLDLDQQMVSAVLNKLEEVTCIQ